MTPKEIAASFALKKLPSSEVELTGSVPAEAVAAYKLEALKHIAEGMELPGFRKGHVPADLALKTAGEMAVLEEAVEHFVQELYPALLEAHTVDAVGRPDIRIQKLAPGNPVELTVRVAVYPEITLPKDWKTLGEKVPLEPAEKATDEELTQTLESLRQNKMSKQEDGKVKLPELNDEFAKSVGAFENLAALKEQIKKGITEEKERKAADTRRGKIIDALLEKIKVAVPPIFVESELEKIIAQLKDDIARFNISFEDYLKRVEKTEETIRNEFRAQAEKRAKLQLALNKIAEDEKIKADEKAVEEEIKHALEHFPDAKPELVRIHVETILRNEKVLQLLEGSAKPTEPEEKK